ncbi:MAG: hypothetical protein ACE5F5_11225 [Acidimicrobiia bacterium]
MPSDLQAIADPRLILLAWAAGLSLAAGYVAFVRVVGPGFIWLTASTAGLVGLAGVFASGAFLARAGLVLLVVGLIWAREGRIAGPALVLAGVAYLVQASAAGGWLPSSSAAVALGGVTGEMMLGHWYLVDPRLPRWTLRSLAVAGMAGLAADGAVLSVFGSFPGGGPTLAFWVLLGASMVLMAGVLGALRYPAYSGVMAATGLSYLGVLTTLGAVFMGRALLAGLGPFAI